MRTSIDVSVEVEIRRPVSVVWAYVSDTERIPEWVSEITEAVEETEGPTRVGTIVEYTVEGRRSGTWKVVEWTPPHRMAWDGPPLPWAGGGARPRGSHTLREASEGRTRLITRYQPELVGTLVVMRPYLKWWLRRQRVKDAQALKERIEGRADE